MHRFVALSLTAPGLIVGLTTAGFAADLGASASAPVYTKAPPPPPIISWTGFYVGANAGWGQNRSDVNYVPPGLPFTAVVDAYSAIGSGNSSSDGFAGGGQFGYNFQWQSIVLGAEADFDSFHTSAAFSNVGTPPGNVQLTSSASVSTNWLATVRARAGVALQSWLIYATAGGGATNFNFNQSNTYAGLGTETSSISGTRWAPVYGGGVEYLMAQNWTIKAEYLHADFGTKSELDPFPPFVGQHSHSVDLKTDIVRAGINYRF